MKDHVVSLQLITNQSLKARNVAYQDALSLPTSPPQTSSRNLFILRALPLRPVASTAPLNRPVTHI